MYQNCCKKCGGISLHTEVKGNNTGLYCDDCGAFQKWLGKDELRAFNYKRSKKDDSTMQEFNKNDIAFTNAETKRILEKPYVMLIDGIDEELLINGESLCCHKRLYPFDVLDALQKQGIINFEYIEE